MRIIATGSGLLIPAARAARAGDAVMLPEVEVTEQRPSEAEQRAPTAFVSEVDTTHRDPAIETTADVLQEVVGVQVQHFGGLGAFSTISIRGSQANQVPIFLDGIPISQAQDQTVNLSDLPLDSVQRIDVYRGTVPIGFGGNGIGGVVNLVTKPATATPSTEVSAGYGSFETRKVVASHSEQIGGTSVLAHLTYLGSQGDFTYKVHNPTIEDPTGNETVTRTNNAFNSVGTLLKGTRELANGLALDGVEEFFFKDQGVPGPGTLGLKQFTDPSLLELRSLSYLRLRANGLAGGAVESSGSLFGVYNLQEFDDPQGNFGGAEDTHNQTALFGASNTGTWYAPLGQRIAWFDEVSYEEFFPYNATNEPDFSNSGPTQTRLSTTLSAQDVIALVSDRVELVPSLRYQHLLDKFSGVNSVDIPNTSPGTNNLDLWTPAAGAQGRFAPWLTLRANIGRFQRAPSFSELFGTTGTVEGNANLKPETGINRDVGFLAEAGANGWIDRAQLEFAYFHNNVDDLIAFTQVNPKTFRAMNVGAARITGEELSLTCGALGHFALELNYTHESAENLSEDNNGNYHGKQLPLRPADELFARTELFNPWGKLYYEYTYLSSDPTDFINFTIVPSRSVHTVGFVATPRDWIAIKFEAANITNADIRDLGDFPLPGLSFFGSIKVTL
jgi:outer membrane receptor protein involved in Fe transport